MSYRAVILPFVVQQQFHTNKAHIFSKIILSIFYCCVIAIFTLQTSSAEEQDSSAQTKFFHFSTQQGLPQNGVLALNQDKEGFVWIGSQAGLSRFDGYRIKNYTHDPSDNTTISSNLISAITTDSNGTTWAGTFPSVVNKLNALDGSFSRVKIPSTNSRYIKALVPVFNKIWVAIETNFFTLEADSLSLKEFPTPNNINEDAITILNGFDESVWLIKESSIHLVDTADKLIKSFDLNLNKSEKTTAADFGNGIIYLATNSGRIYSFDTNSEVLIKIDELQFSVFNIKNNSQKFVDIKFFKNTLWIATESKGLIKYSISTKEMLSFSHQNNNTHSISDNRLNTIMIDKSGLIWIGTSSNGFDRTSGASSNFNLFREPITESNASTENNFVGSLLTADNNIWVANLSGDLKLLNKDTKKFTSYPLPNAGISTKERYPPAALIELSHETILYGSKFGLWEFNRKNRSYESISMLDSSGNQALSIISGFQDPQKRIWLGSSNQGIGLYKQETKQVTWFPVPAESSGKFSNFVLNIAIASDDLLWIGTSTGLIQFNIKTKQYLNPNYSNNNNLLENQVIRTLYKSSQNKLWVGTFSGAYGVEKVAEMWEVTDPFKEIEKLSNNIYAFLQHQENMWITTNYGLAKVNLNTLEYKFYNSLDGLQGEEFNGNVAFSLDNEFWFGGINGLSSFKPSQIASSNYLAPVWITGYQIDDQYHAITNPVFFDHLTVPNASKLLRIEFASLDFQNTHNNKYRIKINDQIIDWTNLDARNELIYSQLEPGDIKICIQGSNHDGIWNPECRPLLITVKSGFWESGAAYSIYMISFFFIAFIIFRIRNQRINKSRLIMQELEESQEQLNWSLRGSGDALWIWDIKSNIAIRKGVNRLLGYQPGELDEPYTDLDSLIHPDDLELTRKSVLNHLNTLSLEHFELEYRMKDAKGEWRWILDRGQIVTFDKNGDPEKLAGTFRDISNRKEINEAQKLSALIIRNMAEMVIVADENLRIISANPSWCHKMAYQLHEVIGKDPSLLNSPNQEQKFYDSVREHLLRFGSWQGEMLQRKKNSQDLLVFMELTIVKNEDQSIRNFVSVATDITEKKRAEDELRYLANYDMLTNLPNRTLFLDRLEHAILQAQRNQTSIALLFIDLDNFKNINDSLGHNYGDLLLKEAALLITHCVRKDDTVSRLGGDEFTVILENITDSISVLQIAEKIIGAFNNTIQIAERIVTSTPSIGISLYPEDANSASSLVKFADTAMYFAKSQGKNNFQYYSESMNKNALRRLDLESHLRGALENQEFHLLYQPKVCATSGIVTGMEALIRWTNPVVGNVTPDEFIPLAEDTGLIVPIGNWVLQEACEQAKRWIDKGFDKLEISVNLSFRQFKDSDLAAIVSDTLAKSNLPGKHLTLEITESLLMDNISMATEQLEQLKKLGLKIAIDDFGTGYSSLNYLKQFPLDYLKIDRTFVKDILINKNDASLTSAIIALSHNLDLTVIAEGVELVGQLEFLKNAGCEEIQGFLVSQPISHYEFGTLLENSKNKDIFTLLKQEN